MGAVLFIAVAVPSWVNNYVNFNCNWKKWGVTAGTGLWIWTSGSFLCLQWISFLYEPDQIRSCQQWSNSTHISSHFTVTASILIKSWQEFLGAIATCWKCVLQVRKYERECVITLIWSWKLFSSGMKWLGLNSQKPLRFLSSFKVRLTLRHVTGRKTSLGFWGKYLFLWENWPSGAWNISSSAQDNFKSPLKLLSKLSDNF